MRQASYNSTQKISWYKTIIRHAAIRVNKKYSRWAKESLTLNKATEQGDEFVNLLPSESADKTFHDSNLSMLLETLPARERLIIKGIYENGNTQREIAQILNVSQSKVSQLHRKIIKKLRRTFTYEMQT